MTHKTTTVYICLRGSAQRGIIISGDQNSMRGPIQNSIERSCRNAKVPKHEYNVN